MAANLTDVYFSIKNLPSLSYLFFSGTIDENIVTKLLDQFPHIQELFLHDNLCYFNLDNFVNLRRLSLFGTLDEKFNFELFKNLSNQLEGIKIGFVNFDEKTFVKLFDGYNFPYLVDLIVMFLDTKRLKKQLLKGFPTLRQLKMTDCKIEVIENDSFLNLQQLFILNLSKNQIHSIENNALSKLKNLQKLDLSDNKLTSFDSEFIGLRKSVKLKIENNSFNV